MEVLCFALRRVIIYSRINEASIPEIWFGPDMTRGGSFRRGHAPSASLSWDLGLIITIYGPPISQS